MTAVACMPAIAYTGHMSARADHYVHPGTGRFVVLTCNVDPDEEMGGYVSRCPVLGVASQGETIDEAEDNIREAVCMYLSSIDEDGELDCVFAKHGLKVAYLEGESQPLRARTAGGGHQITEPFPINRAA